MFDCLIHSKDKQEAANSKHLFSRVCGNIFATSTELYVYRNVYYTLELRENINKSTQPKKSMCQQEGSNEKTESADQLH